MFFPETKTNVKPLKNAGAFWTGEIDGESPEKLDAIIDTTPVWTPVVSALTNLKNGGVLVINALRKEEYDQEKTAENII